MRYLAVFLLIFLCLWTMGCTTTGGNIGTMNVQRAGLRGAGDLSVTVMLDQIPTTDIEELKAHITTFLYAVEEFVVTGNAATLTRTELANRLIEVVADDYAHWVSMALQAALATTNPQVQIGEDNRRRILAFTHGSLTATSLYNVIDRADARGKLRLRKSLETGLPTWPETAVGNAKVKTKRSP